jgi:SAM-dependent methyltransferase
MHSDAFYDDLAPFYHLIYPDWEASVARQAEVLDGIVREAATGPAARVLDVSCGIGTQSLGLARLGYAVTGSDPSARSVERARREAEARGLAIRFSVADMREAFARHGGGWDVVISCDNAVPHLLSDAEIRAAFDELHRCTRPGGLCLVTVRDYAAMELGGTQVKPYGVRSEGGIRYLAFQVWDFEGDVYDLTMYFVEDRGGAECRTLAFRSRYHAVSVDRLLALLREAGFAEVRRIDDRFFQPVLLGRRPTEP